MSFSTIRFSLAQALTVAASRSLPPSAQSPGAAEVMYDEVRAALGKAYDPARIHDGRFGAMMEVASVNDVRPSPSLPASSSRAR